MAKKLFLIVLWLSPFVVNAQEIEADQYESEFIWGINKNTAGGLIGGLVLRKSKKIGPDKYQSFGIELVNVKHSQEIRRNSVLTGNLFIYGKKNYLYAIRGQYGREMVLFKKAPEQGVEVKFIGAVGPSIGIVAPYYVDYIINNQDNIRSGQYNEQRYEQILGPGNLFQGIQKSKIQMGLNLKAALSFELGTMKSHVTGFEVGFLVDAYAKEVELMPAVDNHAVFPTAFITLFYGSRR